MRCEIPGDYRLDKLIKFEPSPDSMFNVSIHYFRIRNGEKVVRRIEKRNEWLTPEQLNTYISPDRPGREIPDFETITEADINSGKCKIFVPPTSGGRQRRAKSHRKRNNRRKSTRRNSRR